MWETFIAHYLASLAHTFTLAIFGLLGLGSYKVYPVRSLALP